MRKNAVMGALQIGQRSSFSITKKNHLNFTLKRTLQGHSPKQIAHKTVCLHGSKALDSG